MRLEGAKESTNVAGVTLDRHSSFPVVLGAQVPDDVIVQALEDKVKGSRGALLDLGADRFSGLANRSRRLPTVATPTLGDDKPPAAVPETFTVATGPARVAERLDLSNLPVGLSRYAGRALPKFLRPASRRPTVTDFLIAVVAVGLDLSLFTQLSDAPDQTSWVSRDIPPAVIIGAGLIAVVPLSFRRRAPTAVCLIVAGQAALVTVTLGSRPLVSVLVALYTAAVWSDRVRARVCLAAVLAAHALAIGYEASFAGSGLSAFAVTAVALVYGLLDIATWAAGRWGSSAAARARARELEASRAASAAAAVDTERLRIARELHDIVAHAVTVMVLQSAGASRMAVKNPELAAGAMRAVENTGKQAVAELRRLLEVLRAEDTAQSAGDGAVDQFGGTSRLANLDDLVVQIRSIGIDVAVQQTGTPCSLDASVDLAAYRVIQEALTNVNKHAGAGAAARVQLSWEPSELVIEVLDDGQVKAGVEHPASGYGLVGLAERVKLVGGRLESGPRAEGGFRVHAVLPTSGSDATDAPDAIADARSNRSWTS